MLNEADVASTGAGAVALDSLALGAIRLQERARSILLVESCAPASPVARPNMLRFSTLLLPGVGVQGHTPTLFFSWLACFEQLCSPASRVVAQSGPGHSP